MEDFETNEQGHKIGKSTGWNYTLGVSTRSKPVRNNKNVKDKFCTKCLKSTRLAYHSKCNAFTQRRG